jgi:hypothetical protein
MKQKVIAKQRNRLVALALFRKAGTHQKSNKAIRRQENVNDRRRILAVDT